MMSEVSTATLADHVFSGEAPLILDTRPLDRYHELRLCGSTCIPLEELPDHCFLLPDKGIPFAVVIPAHDRAQAERHLKGQPSVAAFLRSRGRQPGPMWEDGPALWCAARALGAVEEGAPSPEARQRLRRRWLFRPAPLLAQCVDMVEASLAAAGGGGAVAAAAAASAAVSGRAAGPLLPPATAAAVVVGGAAMGTAAAGEQGSAGSVPQPAAHLWRALDLGCGSGRDAAWLAARHPSPAPPTGACAAARGVGHSRWHVTGVDEWVGALQRAEALALHAGLGPQHVRLLRARAHPELGLLERLPCPASEDSAGAPPGTTLLCAGGGSSAGGEARPDGGGGGGDDSATPLPDYVPPLVLGTFHLVLCVRFLERALLPHIPALVAPGGWVLYATWVDGPGLRAFGRPSGASKVLQPGELATCWFGPDQGFEVVRDDVAITCDGRELSMFAARKAAGATEAAQVWPCP